ncbi:hypothetical protein [Curtobacterium sp. MCBD17_040]|uniref:hypothetical protein n=1 Tax=Curtobacterium sp. MCBD17_040 TaxID=2175674 RepID=UPI0011B4689C|nr:hypothetical protein [Curtobacterium sp. MCBD17_040]WIB65358.1 hypothetical protein DEI94_18295 [Curtobacterium sp. MCBD17_040]
MLEMLTAKDIIELLRNHYIAPSKPSPGFFCPELSDPTDKRRADLIWVPTTWQERGQLIGHEVKVSRADVVAELADPTKADAWARYCDRWWLVVSDPALIDGLTIPEHWGVMAPPSKRRRRTMTVLRPAPQLTPADKTLALANVLARLHNTGDDVFTRMQRLERERDTAVRTAERLETVNARLGEQLRGTAARPRETEKITAILDAVTKRTKTGGRHQWLQADPDAVAVAALDYALIRRKTQFLLRRIDERVSQFSRALAPTDVTDIVEGLTGLSRRVQKDLDDADAAADVDTLTR